MSLSVAGSYPRRHRTLLLKLSFRFSTLPSPLEHTLSHPIYVIWGSNTGVGKTLVSTGIAASAIFSASAPTRVLYIKPLQTGFPSDSDSRFVFRHVSRLFHRRKPPPEPIFTSNLVVNTPEICNSACYEENLLLNGGRHGAGVSSELLCKTLYTWRHPVSPHLAALKEDNLVDDSVLQSTLQMCLNRSFQKDGRGVDDAWGMIETAGGVASPAPSGTLQCDLYRPFRLPAVLVGDGKLGGISGTISAFETLSLRGYDVVAVVVEDHGLKNEVSLSSYLRKMVPVLTLPPIPEDPSEDLMEWFEKSDESFCSLKNIMAEFHSERRQKLMEMRTKAVQKFWWPFTQHRRTPVETVTVIDSRAGGSFSIYKAGRDIITQQFDACASWWTQGPELGMQVELARAMGYATARFGHVMFPENVHEPGLECAELLLGGVGRGWASRVFFSDNGSTSIEISLKMAFRKYCFDHCIHGNVELKVLALHGSYHGDTLGAMEAQAPSSFTGFYQHPWYTGRGGVYLRPPTIFLRNRLWHVSMPPEMSQSLEDLSFNSMDEIFSKGRDFSKHMRGYVMYISSKLSQFSEEGGCKPVVGALIIEPIVHAAGGMNMVDPLFQRSLVRQCKIRKIPVIFDEVFTGFWRLGVESAAELLGCEPDIACYAKLLTGGVVPMAVTLTTSQVFDAFIGESKLEALLHGHSYTAHALGCTAAVRSMRWFKDPERNSNVRSDGVLKELWDSDVALQISSLPCVSRVVAVGTVFAAELRGDGENEGYASLKANSVVRELREEDGVYVRPLGNVVYLMCGPCTPSATCTLLLSKLRKRLDEFGEDDDMVQSLVG